MSVKAKIRFDYKVEAGENRRFFWQKTDLKEAARQIRDQQVILLRNLPFQGLNFADWNLDNEIYLIPESPNNRETAYAPVEMIVEADSIEDLMPLTLREEFRKIRVLEPEKLSLSSTDVERFLFKVNEEYRADTE